MKRVAIRPREKGQVSTAQRSDGALTIGPIRLYGGVTHRHALIAIYSALTTISLLVFINLVQPYLFVQVLDIPRSQLGSTTGRLAALHEIVAIVCMFLVGALSDRWGRRLIYSAGFLFMGIGYFAYPLADNLTQLVIFRALFAVGGGTVVVMFTAIAIDYSTDDSRGKWIGLLNFVSGIGVLIMTLVMSRIPAMLESAGYDGSTAGRYTFWIASALCLFSATVLALGLKSVVGSSAPRSTTLASIKTAVTLGFRDQRLALTYGAAFIGRGDLVIIGMFLPLWVTQAALQAGLSSSEAAIRAGLLLFVHQIAVVAWAFLAGFLNDRFNKLALLVLAFSLASFGYFSLWLVNDPFSTLCFVGVIILATGEITIVITNNAIVGDQAPIAVRGGVLGLLGVAGGIGIILATLLGGEAFDAFGGGAPFLMMVGFNVLIIIWVLWLMNVEDRRTQT